jgi:hypothetical protein
LSHYSNYLSNAEADQSFDNSSRPIIHNHEQVQVQLQSRNFHASNEYTDSDDMCDEIFQEREHLTQIPSFFQQRLHLRSKHLKNAAHKILIVDDEPFLLFALKKMLSSLYPFLKE